MQLFLLAVIMRQVAILIILLLGYGIYKLWTSEKIAKKYTNLAISVYMTLLICALVTVAVLWFRDALDYISNDYMLFVLNSSYNFITLEAMIGILIFGVGLSIINFDKLFNSGINNRKLGWFVLFFGIMTTPIGYTIYEQKVNLDTTPEPGIIRGFPTSKRYLNKQFFTDTVTNQSETVLYTNNQDISVSLVNDNNVFDVSKTITYKEFLKFLKPDSIRLNKGSVTREIRAKNATTNKETSGFLERLTDYEQKTLPLQIKVTKVSLINETITTTVNIRPSLVYKTEDNQYFHIEYEIINREEVDSLRDSKDRFDVFYTKNQFGKYLFEHRYDNHIDESIQSLLQIDYQQLADYEFDNSDKVFFIYRDKTSLRLQEPTLILVLKNEYHDYYDQLN